MDENKQIRSNDEAVIIRSVGDGKPDIIEGYAVVFDSQSKYIYDDITGDFIYETINRSAITQDDVNRWDIVATLEHDSNQMLARSCAGKGSLRLEVDERGLKYSFEVPSTIDGQRAIERIRRKEVFGSSFIALYNDKTGAKYSRNAEGKICREITKFDLMVDVSLVMRPAYPSTSAIKRSLEDSGLLTTEKTFDNEAYQTQLRNEINKY